MKLYKLLILTLIIICSCKTINNTTTKTIISNQFNFGFELEYDDNFDSKFKVMPWSINFPESYQLDTNISKEGNNSIYVKNIDINELKGFVYQANLPVPFDVKNIEISCHAKKKGEGQDTFSLLAFSYDAPKENNYILTYDSTLIIKEGNKWTNYSLSLENTKEFNSILFGFETKGQADYWIDDFDVKYDGVSLNEYSFFKNDEINLINKYINPFEYKTLEKKIDDLTFLSNEIADKKVIGLGEFTHGTREIFQIKNRIIKYLVEKEGFNTIIFEEMMDKMHYVNEYVLNEDKEVLSHNIMKYFTHVFQTEEIWELISWTKKYNKGKAVSDKVLFLGCDMQDGKESIEFIKDFAKNNDKELLKLIFDYEKEYRVYENIEIIKLIQNHLSKLKEKKSLDKSIYPRLIQSGKLLEQFAIFDANLGNRSIHRDSSMAVNIKWILNNYPNRKAVFLADNHHVKKQQIRSSGGYLAKLLNEKYYVIGTSLANGTTYGKSNKEIPLSPRLLPTRREYYLNAVKDSLYFLPLNKFTEELKELNLEYTERNKSWEFNLFDAFIHIKKSSASRKLKNTCG